MMHAYCIACVKEADVCITCVSSGVCSRPRDSTDERRRVLSPVRSPRRDRQGLLRHRAPRAPPRRRPRHGRQGAPLRPDDRARKGALRCSRALSALCCTHGLTPPAQSLLVSEVNLLKRLRHANIVKYYDRIVDWQQATLYIIMEFCEAGDLGRCGFVSTRNGHFF